ncbi:unnamed protein product, partial [Closterium sp. Yama58-4]
MHRSQLSAIQKAPTAGLDPEIVQALPTVTFAREKLREGCCESFRECAVCLGEYEEGECIKTLPSCGHRFHATCIDIWFCAHTTCPICRFNLKPPKPPGQQEDSQGPATDAGDAGGAGERHATASDEVDASATVNESTADSVSIQVETIDDSQQQHEIVVVGTTTEMDDSPRAFAPSPAARSVAVAATEEADAFSAAAAVATAETDAPCEPAGIRGSSERAPAPSHSPDTNFVISTTTSDPASSAHNVSAFPAASPPTKRKISALLPHDPAPGNCSAPIHGSPAEQCAAARAEAACRSGAQLEYLQFFYCTFEGSPVLGVALLLTWLAALIFLLGNVAADFFCPSLEELAELLRLPPAVAGVTLLPLGNGAPDVFASVVAFVGKGHQSLVGFNGVLGAACFVSTVVAGSVCLVAASKAPRVQLHRSSFTRDLTFFLLAVLALCMLVWQRAVHLPHALLFFAIYPAYCLVVALYHCLPTPEARTPRFQIHPFLRSVSQATLPHWLWTHERSLFHSRLHTHHYLHPSTYLSLPFIFSRENSDNSDAPPGHVEAEDVTAGSCSVVLPPRLLSPPLSSSPSRAAPPVLHSAASADFAGADDADTAAVGCAGDVAGATRGSGNRMAASVTDDLREPLWGYDEEMEDPELRPWTFAGFCEYFIKFPLTLPLLCSIPVHHKDEWSKPFAVASSLLSPLLFTTFVLGADSDHLVFILAASLGVFLACLTYYTTEEESPPQSFLPALLWVTASFAMSVVWFYALANELVALLVSLGVILGISPPILALTVLAWGNSVGDLVANLSFAASGDQSRLQIAWSGCFAGPLFNTLVGLGLSLVLACWSRYPEPYVVPVDHTLLSTLGFLFLVLLFVLVRLGWLGERAGDAVNGIGGRGGIGRGDRAGSRGIGVTGGSTGGYVRSGGFGSSGSSGSSIGRGSSGGYGNRGVVLDKWTGVVLVAAYCVFLSARLLTVLGVLPPLPQWFTVLIGAGGVRWSMKPDPQETAHGKASGVWRRRLIHMGTWYDVASLLAHRKTESGEEQVLVRFFGFADEEDEWVSARLSVRPRSLPCEGSECVAVLPGDVVLCFQEASDQALYFDADVRDVQRRRHDVRGCRCRFWVRYRHDNTEEVVPLRKICRRPETEYRVKAAQQVAKALPSKMPQSSPQLYSRVPLTELSVADLDTTELISVDLESSTSQGTLSAQSTVSEGYGSHAYGSEGSAAAERGREERLGERHGNHHLELFESDRLVDAVGVKRMGTAFSPKSPNDSETESLQVHRDHDNAPSQGKLGMLTGVYIPCVQNILGIIFYIRLS